MGENARAEALVGDAGAFRGDSFGRESVSAAQGLVAEGGIRLGFGSPRSHARIGFGVFTGRWHWMDGQVQNRRLMTWDAE